MGAIEMQKETTSSHSTRPFFDEKILPQIINEHVSKLNELEIQLNKAIDDAKRAEEQAIQAERRSASFWSFSDQKKAAIEELQAATKFLSSAVQSGVQAQKISFEFQTRVVEVTKYLFNLGVNNIAANRFVVRELEIRLRGASENELSELARREVMSVVEQLKEHEDLLHKQEMMRDALNRHADTIKVLQEQINSQDIELDLLNKMIISERSYTEESIVGVRTLIKDLRDELKTKDSQQRAALTNINNYLDEVSNKQQQEIENMQKQLAILQNSLNTFSDKTQAAHADIENNNYMLRSSLNTRTLALSLWTVVVTSVIYFLLR